MDCLFNRQIPLSTFDSIIFKPKGKTFISGIAFSYDFFYDKNFIGDLMADSQFNYLTNALNDELYSYWPCTLCFCFGYLFSPCTLGLSFLCPNMCITSAKENFIKKLEYFNSKYFNPKMINITYHQKCSTSWLKLERLDLDYSKSKSIDIKDYKYDKLNSLNDSNAINMMLISKDKNDIINKNIIDKDNIVEERNYSNNKMRSKEKSDNKENSDKNSETSTNPSSKAI